MLVNQKWKNSARVDVMRRKLTRSHFTQSFGKSLPCFDFTFLLRFKMTSKRFATAIHPQCETLSFHPLFKLLCHYLSRWCYYIHSSWVNTTKRLQFGITQSTLGNHFSSRSVFNWWSFIENKTACNESDPLLARQTDSQTDTHRRVTHSHMIIISITYSHLRHQPAPELSFHCPFLYCADLEPSWSAPATHNDDSR